MSSEQDERTTSSYQQELNLRREIESFYLPRQLINAISELGKIPDVSQESLVSIGFLDIADYSFLSKFLSPHENQAVLNGLYSAFNWVLQKHGGYLNKIEGDSLMFHYGGPIDPLVKDLEEEDAVQLIARELFYTCVELQRVCSLFNQANENILYKMSEGETVSAIKRAYSILNALRNNQDMSSAFNAVFQLRIRIGASIGRVLIGNFGPDGAKYWDVIGLPVIDAKRMESSAPIGGLRITKFFYDTLKKSGTLQEYYNRFHKEAQALESVYQNITFEDLYHGSRVFLKDKKNADFDTYSIQVNPALPEDIARQTELLLQKGYSGANRIVGFLKYYRGNRFVIGAIEKLFEKTNIVIRKESLYRILLPEQYKELLEEQGGDAEALSQSIREKCSLFELMSLLGERQDFIKKSDDSLEEEKEGFESYYEWVSGEYKRINTSYLVNKESTHQAYYFHNVIFPLVFQHIKASILEYQTRLEQVSSLSDPSLNP